MKDSPLALAPALIVASILGVSAIAVRAAVQTAADVL